MPTPSVTPPDTLPADFFSNPTTKPPDTLPADFFASGKQQIDYGAAPQDRGVLGEAWEGVKGVADALNPIPAMDAISKLSPFSAEGNQGQKAREMFVDPVLQQQQKAREQIAGGDTTGGVIRGVVGSVPVAGPALMGMSDEIQNPETRSHGIGRAIGTVLAPEVYARAGETLAKVAPEPLRKAAVEQYVDALNPTKEKNKVVAPSVARGALDRGVSGGLQGIQDEIRTTLPEKGRELQNALQGVAAQQPPVAVSISPILQKLNALRQKSVTNGVVTNQAAVSAIDDWIGKLNEMAQNDTVGSPTDISYTSLRQARRDLDNQVGSGHIVTTEEGPGVLVKRRTANAIRNELAQARPDVAKIDAEYSFWKDFDRVVSATNMRKTGQAPPLLNTIAAVGAGAAGYSHSGGLLPSVGAAGIGAATMWGLAKLVRSPVWQTTSATFKNQLADALATNNTTLAEKLIGSVGAANAATQPFTVNRDKPVPQFAKGGIVQPTVAGQKGAVARQKRRRWYPPMPSQKSSALPKMPQ